jgi:redox-sensitive bicupin YhaK (pirin superfamily)
MNRRNFVIKSLVSIASITGLGFFFKKKLGSSTKKVKYLFNPREQHWVGDGFHVHTMIYPGEDIYPYTSPFVLLDYAPASRFSPSSKKRGVGEHPHRGFETVTFAIQGEIEHRDSAGGGGTIGTGDVQWMTAASGVVHEEFHSQKFTSEGGMMEMVQLWVNLPAKDKMSSPRYQDIQKESMPIIQTKEQTIKVVAGEYQGKKGPSKTFTEMKVFESQIKAGSEIAYDFKAGSNSVLLVLDGEIEVEGKSAVKASTIIYEREGDGITFKTRTDSKLLVLNATPIDEPIVAHGPFVMNTRQEIIQAIDDYRNGKMGRLDT